LSEKKKVVPH